MFQIDLLYFLSLHHGCLTHLTMKPGSSSRAALAIFCPASSHSASSRYVTSRHPARRSSSSASSSRSSLSAWEPVLPPGANQAYDVALAYLSHQQSLALDKIAKLRAESQLDEKTLRRIDKLEVEAYVNDPAVRKTFRETRGRGMMERPVMRHLAERRWKKDGGLDLIMGRVFQNKVVPDLVPDLGPTSPLTLTVGNQLVEPGIPLDPSALESRPTLTFQPFDHPSSPTSSDSIPTGLYTLLVIDPDTPSPSSQAYSQRLHYLKIDIPLSIATGETNLFSDIGKIHLDWEPPAPEQGSDKHRYVFILLHQQSPSLASPTSREDFDFRRYLTTNGYTDLSIVGISLFRSEWRVEQAEYIDSVFRRYRKMEASPVYGRPPKEVKYGYPLSSVQRRAEEIRSKARDEAVGELEHEDEMTV